MVAFDHHALGGLLYRHGGVSGKQIYHHALVGRIEMLHQNKGHAVVTWQGLDQFSARVQPTRRGADPDDREAGGGGMMPLGGWKNADIGPRRRCFWVAWRGF